MSAFGHAWESLVNWVPPPLQVGLALVITALIVTKIAPRIIRVCGVALRTGWEPLLGLLTYPEFLLTTAARRLGWQPLPGTYGYGRTLGALAPPGARVGEWLANRRKGFRFPWKTTLLVIAVLTTCWYVAPNVPSGGPQTLLANINTDDVRINTWLSTGRWTLDAPVAPCIPTPAHTKPPHKNKPSPHKKRKHHHSKR
jgi:hypothetical protein